jgi:hypothetical protein
MAFKLGVLLIHGMGNQDAGFADEMIETVKHRLNKMGSNDRDISFEAIWWAHVLGDKEATLLRYMADGNDLEWMSLRSFVVNSLGDALAYQDTQVSKDEINVYQGIHKVVAEKTAYLRSRIRSGVDDKAPEVPLVVIAHSLGAQIMSNYIWDIQKGKPLKFKVGDNPFERYETLTSIITFGCNIPLFTLALNNIEPIDFPPSRLASYFPPGTSPEEISSVAKWINLYDPDDVLGYPLKTLDPKYDKIVYQDIPVNVGSILRSWNPASHTAYWTDDNVIKPVAESLHNILRILPRTSANPGAAPDANRASRGRRR